jgi:hypothetical protein
MPPVEVDPNLRLIVGWTGLAIFNLAALSVPLVAAWFFVRMVRGDVRLAQHVTQHPAQIWGLAALACAGAAFGAGLAVSSLDSAPLVPLGVGFIGLSIAVGAYGIRLLRTRS